MTRANAPSARRVAIVIQRYGTEVIGGSEALCRMVAERMARSAEVTVFTTCALDALRWWNHYPPGETEIGGVRVVRFPVRMPRILSISRLLRAVRYVPGAAPFADEALLRVNGPWAPALPAHLASVRARFDLFVFYTFLFYPTAVGIREVADRAVLVPTAHDEPKFFAPPVERTLSSARRIIALTPEEEALIRRRMGNRELDIRVAACGIEAPSPAAIERAPELARGPYLLTLGRKKPRVEDVPELLRAFRARYGNEAYVDDAGRSFRGGELRWVLAGDASYARLRGDGIEAHGSVDESAKWRLITGALALVNPSLYESLSLTLLEAWAVGRPTLAEASCLPMAGQTARSGGGSVFTTPRTFADALHALLRDPEARRATGERGRAFVNRQYTWDSVLSQYWDDDGDALPKPSAGPKPALSSEGHE